MNIYIMQCLIAFVVFPMVISTPVNIRQDQETLIDIRLVEERTDARTKRSISESNLPEKLVFDIPTLKGEARLTLKRRPLLPLYDSDGLVSSTLMDDGVFVDQSMHSAMIVKREGNEYKLKGIFNHEGQNWDLKPLERKTRSAETHQVGPMQAEDENKTTFTFDSDQIYPDGDHVVEDYKEATNNITGNVGGAQSAFYNHVVEIAFVVDHANYVQFYNMFSTNVDEELRLWYTYVAESINIRYQTIDDSMISIKTKVNHLLVLKRISQNGFIVNALNNATNQLVDLDILNAFRVWVNHDEKIVNKPVPTSDHYMLFTGFELEKYIGLAFVGALCTNSSVSVVVATFQGQLGLLAAHELGHSLSARHDATRFFCTDSSQYIMASAIYLPETWNTGNQWRFSSCSISSFRTFLSSVTCSRYWNTNENDVLPSPKDGSRAGEVLLHDQQCELYFINNASFFCENLQLRYGYSKLCSRMYCSIPFKTGYCRPMIPQEFTNCGNSGNKWCIMGECVDNGKTTKLPTTVSKTTTTSTTPKTTVSKTTTTYKTTITSPKTSRTTKKIVTTSSSNVVQPFSTLYYAVVSAFIVLYNV